jgi:hypothetical protein
VFIDKSVRGRFTTVDGATCLGAVISTK